MAPSAISTTFLPFIATLSGASGRDYRDALRHRSYLAKYDLQVVDVGELND
jgi:hypothetical protein